MEENKKIEESLLLDYILDRCNASDKARVESWLNEHPSHAEQLEAIRRLWQETGRISPAPLAFETDAAFDKVWTRIASAEGVPSPHIVPGFRRSRTVRYALAIAASVLLITGMVSLVRLISHQASQTMLFALRAEVTDTLPDGSIIKLRQGSWIKYNPQTFNKNRTISLYGEGFFRVARDPSHPFTVNSERVQVKVLGTVFDLKARTGSDVIICVTEGRVSFSNASFAGERGEIIHGAGREVIPGSGGEVILEAGNKGVLSLNHGDAPRIETPAGDEMFWNNNSLVFNGCGLRKVIPLLESAYNTRISVSDTSILGCRLSASFSEETIQPLLEVIASTFSLQLEKSGETWHLKGKGCAK